MKRLRNKTMDLNLRIGREREGGSEREIKSEEAEDGITSTSTDKSELRRGNFQPRRIRFNLPVIRMVS